MMTRSTHGSRAMLALVILFATAAVAAPSLHAQLITIDASAPTSPPGPANYKYDADDEISPTGHTLGLNARYLTLDGKPWLPVMGEMHYTRVPEAEWETEILKMKSAGVQVIATYIIWIHHEEVQGQWEWTGQKDLRRFVQLCAKHGMYVVPRIGPWSHAEVRNGGFPDWLLTQTTQQRSNDPAYLHFVDLYYKQIAAQLKGLMWREGGPVIAIQLENEYHNRGALGGTAHILKLKQMAQDDGMRVPFFTVTSWDGAAMPAGEVLPVDGGYPDAPWDASIGKLPPNGVYAFHFGTRSITDMGAIGVPQTVSGAAPHSVRQTPFITAEMGGGMQVTYHRRPIVSADDIAAMMPVMLGSGVNLYGTYMFHGGENPDGKLTTLQESLATHYANDLPQKSYDFEAPIGEFGDERESLLKLKTWNYFLNDFGPTLAPMQPHAPQILPSGPSDFTVPRVAARTSGSSGFLFVNNQVRGYPMPGRTNFQVAIKLPGNETLTLPSKPITIPADAYFVWPFNMDLGGLHLRFATAQPFAILGTKAAPVYAFIAQPGIDPEFVIDDTTGLKFDRAHSSPYIQETPRDNALVLHKTGSIGQADARFILPSGKRVTILLLYLEGAEHSWKVAHAGTTQLLWTPQQAFVDGEIVTLQNSVDNSFLFNLTPDYGRVTSPSPAARLLPLPDGGYSASFASDANRTETIATTQIKPADAPAPLPANFKPSTRPRVVAAAPTDADFSRAAIYSIPLPKSALTDTPTQQHFLRITYTGDVAHLTANNHLLDDNFADGRPWLVGLARFAPQLQKDPTLQLSIYPLRPNPPIFFEPGYEPKPTTPPAALQSVELLTQYTLKLKLQPLPAKKP